MPFSCEQNRCVAKWYEHYELPIRAASVHSGGDAADLLSFLGTIAVPHDNRQVTLHDLSGQKLLRLPRDGTKCHHRMVTSTCWAGAENSENWRSRANLFSAGFDRVAFGWSVRSSTRDKDEGFKVKEKEKAKDATF